MDRPQQEIAAIQQTLTEVAENYGQDLHDLQLALVGGGSGETILA